LITGHDKIKAKEASAIRRLRMSFVFTENVSAAPGIDASATRYSRGHEINLLHKIISYRAP
jgi:hypothetical protein